MPQLIPRTEEKDAVEEKNVVKENNAVKENNSVEVRSTNKGFMEQMASFGRSNWKPIAIVVTLLVCTALGIRIYQNFSKPIKDDGDKAVLTVTVEPVNNKAVHRTLKLAGTVWAWDPLTIGAEVGGLRIESVRVEEGDLVKRGQVLATLNSSIIRAQLEKERAKLRRTHISLEKTKQPNRPMDINRIKAIVAQASAIVSQEESNVLRAKANLRNAQMSAARYQALRKDGAVSAEDLDNRETSATTANADHGTALQRLEAARFAQTQEHENLKLAMEGGMSQDIDMAKADIAEIQASVKQLEAQVAQTIIKAPSDGLITKRMAHIGDVTMANEDLFQMVRDNRYEVRAQVPEQDLSYLRAKQLVKFLGAAGDTMNGVIREISPTVDTNTRLATARIDIPYDPRSGWRPGMFVSGLVDLGEITALVVQGPSVVDKDGRKIVYVLEAENRVFSREIKTGDRTGDFVEVLSGLKAGEKVVTTGSGFLKDGDTVRLGAIETK
ncbi:MAG: efflux RND transporter periplasmic adaptor subunit [Candidatus Melainabacteria bacterium]|nr:efflux RND transporter periplasmic adaptor subunit [Candidatus Melainabacteria bacterium]